MKSMKRQWASIHSTRIFLSTFSSARHIKDQRLDRVYKAQRVCSFCFWKIKFSPWDHHLFRVMRLASSTCESHKNHCVTNSITGGHKNICNLFDLGMYCVYRRLTRAWVWQSCLMSSLRRTTCSAWARRWCRKPWAPSPASMRLWAMQRSWGSFVFEFSRSMSEVLRTVSECYTYHCCLPVSQISEGNELLSGGLWHCPYWPHTATA